MTTQKKCLNCGVFFADEKALFCKFCGQKRNGNLISLRAFLIEIFGNLFSWDARFWRTIKLLFTKPGIPSKEYCEGKRVRYTNPFRLYFIASIFCFLLQAVLFETVYFSRDWFAFDVKNQDSNMQISGSYENHQLVQIWNEIVKNPSKNKDEILTALGYEKTFFKRWICNRMTGIYKVVKKGDYHQQFIKKIIAILPSFLFLMLPLIALFLKLLYIRGRVHYVKHLVFVFQVQTLFFIVFSLISLTDILIPHYFSTLLFWVSLLFLGHTFFAFKNFYEQTIFKTVLKFFTVHFFIALLFLPVIISTFLLSLFLLE